MAIERYREVINEGIFADEEGDLMYYDDHLTALREQREGIFAIIEKAFRQDWTARETFDELRAYGQEGEEEKPKKECVPCHGTGKREVDIGDSNDVVVTCDYCGGTGEEEKP